MTQIEQTSGTTGDVRKLPYTAPSIQRLGNLSELTKSRLQVGAKDGGPNNTRSG